MTKKVPLSSIPPPPRPRQRIDRRYELLEIAGRGGMAVVWRAHHRGPGRFRRTVAVKQMHLHLAQQRLYRELFEEEARIGSILQDPNIAQVIDFVEEDGQYYLVLEWVNGVDLATLIRYVRDHTEAPVQWELVAAVGVGILRGLAAAHERVTPAGTPEPIVHRDVSPHNVLIRDDGRAKLIDFGLSYARDRDIDDTNPGMAKGKLAYLAPEIVRGGRPSPLTDQFAVGAVLWEALTGRRAFEGPTEYETYERVANAEVPALSMRRPDIPTAFCDLVHRALSLDPKDRFVDTREMARHLGQVLRVHESSEDLYDTLARTVAATRATLGIGQRTQDPNVESDIPELLSGLLELLVEEENKPPGLRKWVPRFLRR